MKYNSELTALIAVICNLALTFFVLSRDLRSIVNRVYFLWGTAVTTWNLGAYFLFRAQNPDTALVWAYVLQCGVILLPITNLHLTLLIAQISIGRLLPVMWGLHLALLVSLFTGHFISGVRDFGFAYYSIAGPGFWAFLALYGVSTSATMVMLYHKQRNLPPLHRKRIRSLLLAYTILLMCGTNDLLPILGYDFYPFTQIKIYPFGNIAAVFYVIVVGYSVLQHQLLDLHVTLSKSAAHIVRLLFLFFTGFVLLALLATLFRDQFTPFSFFSSLLVLLFSAATASLFFPRLFGSGVERLERRILGDRFEYHAQIQGFLESMQWYTDSNLLLDGLHELLVKTMRVRSYHIIVLDEKTRIFSLFRSYPPARESDVIRLRSDAPLFELFQRHRMDYLPFNIAYAVPGETDVEKMIRTELGRFQPEFCFPLYSDDAPFGLFLIGEKISGEPFTPHDLHLLTALVKNLSLHLNQIRLKNQILLAQEMDLLGMMSRGMAHDLNNLMTPIWTFTQLAKDLPMDESTAALLPLVSRNVETIRAYIKEALFFSNTQKPHFGFSPIAQTIQQSIELARPRAKLKQVTIRCIDIAEVALEMDSVLIQRLICNLLANAVDASPVGSEIHVRFLPLSKNKADRDWYRLEVIDHGEGISRENLKKVFIPYFTTKDRGNERRGFGLGLAICRKIVHLHDGNLNIESQESRGTVVQVDLPSHQLNARPRDLALSA
ncbi:MAG: ATP-binding protein [Verrucomicrobiota bacterium]|jgi:signal transduction histidine kinase